MDVTVIIPTWNEEAWVGAAVASAIEAGAAEVIVSDGGSTDATVRAAATAGARVIAGEAMRARQMNRGAGAASGDCLLFLHADTTLPPDAAREVVRALEGGAVFGGFRLAFAEGGFRLRAAAALINARTALTRCPWGDQAQFIRRETFRQSGGFREIAMMEDYDLAQRMRAAGRVAILPRHVITSGRRFLRKGVLRTAFTNWRIIASYRRGVSPDELSRLYRK